MQLLHREIDETNAKCYIIDGFPRTLAQATLFESIVGECTAMLQLKASEEILTGRLIKRAKDTGIGETNKDVIKERLEEYLNKAKPAIDYYTQLGKVRVVDCSGAVAEIYKSVCRAVLPHMYFVIGPKSCGKTALS